MEYGHIRFGGAIDNFLAAYRADLPEWAGLLDRSEPRTAQQIKETEAATRRFPFWGGKTERQSNGMILKQ